MTRTLSATLAALLVVIAAFFAAAPSFAAANRYASPTGTSTVCTAAAPCSLVTAVQNAAPGDTVLLTSGTYPTVTIKAGKATVAAPVVVKPAPGASPVLGSTKVYAANTVWNDIYSRSTFYTYGSGITVDRMHIDGSGIFVRSANVIVRNSTFENGSSIDGIQVGGTTNGLIENNRVQNYDQNIDNGLHADCIQVFESTKVTLRGNVLKNCYNAGIQFSPGAGDGMSDITVESNFVSGCIVVTADCRGGSVADFREVTASNLYIRNNTFENGALRVGGAANTVFDRNIVSYLSSCTSPMTNTIVEAWNTKLCKTPSLLNQQGNVQGAP
ncbi:right-handed parallel beta-helix repeat-containing protein, partial [Rathayibacter sp. ZW T2_19]